MLLGLSVPATWKNVRTVFVALCELAGRDPRGFVNDGPYDYGDGPPETYEDVLVAAWHEALDAVPAPAAAVDPWNEEPPF